MKKIRIGAHNKKNTDPNSHIRDSESSGQPPDHPERVGYRCPPTHSRWQKGVSGNPLGRPSRGNFWADLRRELAHLVNVIEGGKRKRKTAQQVLLHQVVSHATRGNTRYIDMLLKAMNKIEAPEQPEFPKGKAFDYMRDQLAQIITQQRKVGYDERIAEERGLHTKSDFWKPD
jgi:Family of unknown function (DUF5681)